MKDFEITTSFLSSEDAMKEAQEYADQLVRDGKAKYTIEALTEVREARVKEEKRIQALDNKIKIPQII